MTDRTRFSVNAAEVACEIRDVERAFHYHRVPSVKRVGSALDAVYAPTNVTQGIKSYLIEDCVINGRFRIAHKDKAAITESLYGISDDELAQTVPSGESTTEALDGKVCIYAFIWTATNFYHWLMQILTSIESILEFRSIDDVVLATSDKLSHWQERSLQLLGFDRISRFTMQPNRYYKVPALEITDFYIRPTVVTRTGLQTCKRLKGALQLRTPRGRRLYASRKDVTFRRMTNEDELIALLERYGFETLIIGQMTLDQQIATFHDASIVVGPHGQGMSHVAYCNEGTVVWELFPEHFITRSTIGIAQSLGLRYCANSCPQQLSGESAQVTDFAVDLAMIERRLDEVLLWAEEDFVPPVSHR